MTRAHAWGGASAGACGVRECACRRLWRALGRDGQEPAQELPAPTPLRAGAALPPPLRCHHRCAAHAALAGHTHAAAALAGHTHAAAAAARAAAEACATRERSPARPVGPRPASACLRQAPAREGAATWCANFTCQHHTKCAGITRWHSKRTAGYGPQRRRMHAAGAGAVDACPRAQRARCAHSATAWGLCVCASMAERVAQRDRMRTIRCAAHARLQPSASPHPHGTCSLARVSTNGPLHSGNTPSSATKQRHATARKACHKCAAPHPQLLLLPLAASPLTTAAAMHAAAAASNPTSCPTNASPQSHPPLSPSRAQLHAGLATACTAARRAARMMALLLLPARHGACRPPAAAVTRQSPAAS
jgi:hypothetical protein